MTPDQQGLTTVQYVVAAGFSMLLLVVAGNVLVDLYARGVVRDALDEGARSGSTAGAGVVECERRAREVLDGLLRGPTGSDVRVECRVDGPWIAARAEGRLASWLPAIVPDWQVAYEAFALRQP